MPPPIRPDDIYRIRQPLALRASPDGTRAVVTVTEVSREQLKNVTHLWMVDLSGDGPARQFTHGKHSETNPRWSPDGKRIGFVSGRSGKSEVWSIPADGGEARQVTDLKGSVEDFAWHPGGRKLAVVFRAQDADAKEREEKKKAGEPGSDSPAVLEVSRLFYKLDGAGFLPKSRPHLWLVDAETGKGKALTKGEVHSESSPRFSPDGKWLYFLSNRTEDPDRDLERVDFWRMPAGGGAIRNVKKFDGPAHGYSFSPDGRWIAFLGERDAHAKWNTQQTKLWLIPAEGGRPVELTPKLDRSCANSSLNDTFGTPPTPDPAWSPDGKRIAFAIVNEGNTEVWEVSPADRKPNPLLTRAGVALDFHVDWSRSLVHAVFAEARNPGEVVTFPAMGEPGEAVVRTRLNQDWLARRRLATPREVWCLSTGGRPVQGWVLLPPGLRAKAKCPGILYIHGGPAAQYCNAYFHEFQVLAAAGFAVFYSNPRASTGYSRRHQAEVVGRWGTLDYDDLMHFTDAALKAAPEIDRRRLGVAGGSYGGFMTNWIVGHTKRFSAAVSSRGISNFLSFVGSSDFGYAWPKGFFGIDSPWDAASRFLAMSPLSYLKSMKTPMLIEHQEEDHRCPVEQAEQLWAALKYKGVPCEFLRYPQEPHGMSRGGRPDRRLDRMDRIVKWFRRWLAEGS
jgi:dipeptidyl aminopeptidase/acylaminoacyl peptidase